MQKDSLIELFRQLAPMTAADEEKVRARFAAMHVPARTYLMQAGEVAQQCYFVVKGCVRVSILNLEGEDLSCYFATEGMFVSNYESFLTGAPSLYGLQALENCELLAIDRLGLEELYRNTATGERIGRRMAEFFFIDVIQRLTSFYTQTPEERYLAFMAASPQLLNRIPQHYIAAHIGVRPQSLSRIKRRVAALAPH
jgi:CRP-like cAMP-binding protein